MRMRTILFFAVIGCIFSAGCGQKAAPKKIVRPVLAIKVADIEAVGGRTFPGLAEANEEVNLAFEVAGSIVERPVNKGDQVKAGQLLARLDPRDFENALKASKAELARAVAHRDRIKQAAAAGAVAQQDLTDAEASVQVAQADVKIKEKSLEDATIVAPFDGLIAATYAENFQAVQPKQKVLRLLDISRIKVTIDIPESGISLVPYAKDVRASFEAFPDREFPASVKEIGTEASQSTRTYPVTLLVEQPDDVQVLPGMAVDVMGRVELPESSESEDLEVPLSAVASDKEDKKYVWVIDEASGKVARRDVEVGEIKSTGIRVKGVTPGEWIAVAGVHQLQEGQIVRIQG